MNFNNLAKYYFFFGILVVVLIIVLGLLLIFSSYFKYIPINFRIIIALFIISYGSFRLVGIYNNSKKQQDENEIN